MEILQKILQTPSVPGFTQNMASLLKQELSPLFDTTQENVLGGICFTKDFSREGFHLMLACGIDTGGLVATYIDKTKISISATGTFNAVQSLAFSHVTFQNGVSGVLIPSCDGELPSQITSYEVETYDEKEAQSINLGDVAYFDEKITDKNGRYSGFGTGAKMCIYFTLKLAKRLTEDKELQKEFGIGKLSAMFPGQNALGSRGASVEAYNLCADKVINISTADLSEKISGDFDLSDTVFVKVSDAGCVCDEQVNILCENLLDKLGIKHKRRVSSKERNALFRLTLSKHGTKGSEICLGVKYISTKGETVVNPFESL